jgi:hypothetical protein
MKTLKVILPAFAVAIAAGAAFATNSAALISTVTYIDPSQGCRIVSIPETCTVTAGTQCSVTITSAPGTPGVYNAYLPASGTRLACEVLAKKP